MAPPLVLSVNGRRYDIPDPWADEALVHVLREALGLTGTRWGCGSGECGCCAVLRDGQLLRSCTCSARAVAGQAIVTVEGLAGPDGALHPLQQAWLAEAVSQCGFCQSGQLMAAAALLARTRRPSAGEIAAALAGHPCRCGTAWRAQRAVMRAAAAIDGGGPA